MMTTTLMRGFRSKMMMEEPGEPSGGQGSEGAAPGNDTPPPNDTPTTPTAGDQTPPAADYSFLPESYRGEDGTYDLEKFQQDYEDLTAAKSSHDERLASVPEDASGYDFSIPSDIDFGEMDLPEGFEIHPLNEEEAFKPLFDEFGQFLHENQISGDGAKAMMSMIAKYEATKYAEGFAEMKAELESLDGGEERVSSLKRHIETKLPEDEADALMGAISSAAGVRALEKLLGGKNFSASSAAPAAKQESQTTTRYPSLAEK